MEIACFFFPPSLSLLHVPFFCGVDVISHTKAHDANWGFLSFLRVSHDDILQTHLRMRNFKMQGSIIQMYPLPTYLCLFWLSVISSLWKHCFLPLLTPCIHSPDHTSCHHSLLTYWFWFTCLFSFFALSFLSFFSSFWEIYLHVFMFLSLCSTKISLSFLQHSFQFFILSFFFPLSPQVDGRGFFGSVVDSCWWCTFLHMCEI